MNDKQHSDKGAAAGRERWFNQLLSWRRFLLCLLLAVMTLAIYRQTGNHDFINMDDDLYVTENIHVQRGVAGEGFRWAFTAIHAGNWHPLTWLSHMADVGAYGMDPRGHHLTSVMIHTVSACLLFLLLVHGTARPWRSFFVAALFALHPLHVESVAWVAERKDVLCGLFWMLTLLLYGRYVKKPGLNRYLLTLFSFAMALMAKPMAVTLPLVLLLMDFWPFDRRHSPGNPQAPLAGRAHVPGYLKEKIPFLALALLSGFVTFHAQQKWSYVVRFDSLPIGYRLENALVAYASYMGKLILPHDMAVMYPYHRSLPLWQGAVSLLLLTGISLPVYRFRKQAPYLLAGWLWFLGTLLPVIGIIQVGAQSMADRYTYMPSIGLFIMITWGVSDLVSGRLYGRSLLAVSATVALCAFSAVTVRQIGYWKDSGSLFAHALEVTDGNYIAHNNLGMYLRRQGRNREALDHFLRSVAISPGYATGHFNLGVTYTALGNRNAALEHVQTALRLDPGDADARFYLEFLTGTAR